MLSCRFEGSERRAVTKSQRDTVPDLYGRRTEGTTTVLLPFEEGDAKCSTITERKNVES